jgi:nucleoside-diphosphate-sugar epimerase
LHIAIFGATSEIAKDLILSFAEYSPDHLTLFARKVDAVHEWLSCSEFASRFKVRHFNSFDNQEHFDVLINFVGVGNPAQAVAMGASILDITLQYDNMALAYLAENPTCKYIFLSSGAVYGSIFKSPANENAQAHININNLMAQDWYAIAKLYAECRHRALLDLVIIDIRIFNYFSHTQNMNSQYFISEVVRSLFNNSIFETSSDELNRDYLNPKDFFQLITSLIKVKENTVVDAYSIAPISKFELLESLRDRYGLRYQINNKFSSLNSTGLKLNYFSINKRAEKYGYKPSLTSLEGVFKEIDILKK